MSRKHIGGASVWLAVVNLITEAFTSMTKGRDELYCFKIATQAQLSLFSLKLLMQIHHTIGF